MLLTMLCAAAAIAPLKASVGTKRFVLLSSGGVHAVMQNTTIAVTLKIRGGATWTVKAKEPERVRLSNGKRAERSE